MSCLTLSVATTYAAPLSLQPLLPGKWPTPPGTFVSGVAVSGDFAYVAYHDMTYEAGGLQVIDVRHPANCVRVGGHATVGAANAVVVRGNYAYVADSGDESPLAGAGLQVIDVSDPTNCVRVGGYAITNGYALGVAVSGNYAYVAAGQRWTGSNYVGTFVVIDVRNPTNCVAVGGCDTRNEAKNVAVSGNHAYVADGEQGMLVINVSNPTNCVRVGGYRYELSHDTYAVGVAVSGNYAYVTDFYAALKVVDVRDPTNCVAAGAWYTSKNTLGVAVSGNRAYVSAHRRTGTNDIGSIEVLDVRNPTVPVRIAGFDTSGQFPQDVAVVADRIYVPDLAAGLLVLPTVRDLQITLRTQADPGVPFTIEAATDLNSPIPWTPIFTTNVASMPFDYVDFDVRTVEKPRKYYRVRQP